MSIRKFWEKIARSTLLQIALIIVASFAVWGVALILSSRSQIAIDGRDIASSLINPGALAEYHDYSFLFWLSFFLLVLVGYVLVSVFFCSSGRSLRLSVHHIELLAQRPQGVIKEAH